MIRSDCCVLYIGRCLLCVEDCSLDVSLSKPDRVQDRACAVFKFQLAML